ncbi:MAG: TetR/AcrR family transcriptional regulator [Bacteroidales bacterium]|nr:TetR/AcrR family transcriptional regulator [Bacteroidales bacterium]
MAKQSQLEQQILQAAEELFLDKGYDATSTTDIAKRVGCNQALVHYYYRTKENLFEQIFMKKTQLLLSYINPDNQPNWEFEPALLHFIDSYFEMLSHHRRMPFFLIKELILNEDRRNMLRLQMLRNSEKLGYYAQWDKLVKAEVAKGTIRPMETMDLTLDVISLIVFTFISLPLYSDLFQQNEEQLNAYLLRRKEEVTKLILNGIRA